MRKLARLLALALAVATLGLFGNGTAALADGCVGDIGLQSPDDVYGTAGNDTIDCTGAGHGHHIYGQRGADVIFGSDFADVIFGGPGQFADELHGGGGPDELYGEAGNDLLFGDAGDDELYGGPGNDVLNCGSETDAGHAGSGSGDAASGCETTTGVP